MDKTTTTGGIGLGGALFLLFVYLKLTGEIAWSWWWVTAPLWGPVGAIFGAVALFALVLGIIYLAVLPFELVRRRRRQNWQRR